MAAFLLGGGDPPKTDLDELQGTWVMVSMEIEGHEVAAEDFKDWTAVYEQNRVTLPDGVGGRRGLSRWIRFASRRRSIRGIRMDPTRTRPCRASTTSRAIRSSFASPAPGRNDPRSSTTKSGTAFLVCVYKRHKN